MSANGAYTLAAAELPAIRQVLSAEAQIGPMQPQSMATLATLMQQLAALSLAYGAITNPTFTGWLDQLYQKVIATTTCYGQDFPALYIVYNYLQYFNRGDWYQALSPWDDFKTNNSPAPANPPAWRQAIAGHLTAWGENPPSNIIAPGVPAGPGGKWPELQQFEQQVVSAANWTDYNSVLTNIAPVWQTQVQTMQTLLAASTLTADAYFFLLHLLIALPTGAPAAQHLAQQIASASVSSPEYPNDTFSNQLVYLTLLYLADPLGAYGWDNAQLQTALHDIGTAIQATDPASTAIQTSLEQHGKVLYSDSAYPMQDPYSPSIGFTQRKTDTIFALDKARATIQSG